MNFEMVRKPDRSQIFSIAGEQARDRFPLPVPWRGGITLNNLSGVGFPILFSCRRPKTFDAKRTKLQYYGGEYLHITAIKFPHYSDPYSLISPRRQEIFALSVEFRSAKPIGELAFWDNLLKPKEIMQMNDTEVDHR